MTFVLAAVLLATAAPQDTEPRVLLRLEDDWALALIHRDGAMFRRLLADRFIYTRTAATLGGTNFLPKAVPGRDRWRRAQKGARRVHRFGQTAVVTGWLVVAGQGPNGPFDRRYRFTDTWVRRGGRWQIVAAHDYLVPAPHR